MSISKSKEHPIVGKILAELQGDDWKRVQSIASPVFTSSKMRKMCPLVRQSVEGFMNTLSEYLKNKHEVNVKDMYGCLTMDVIANCAFATKTNAFKDPNNPFVVHERNALKFSFLKFISMLLLPQFVLNILKFRTLMNEKSVDFFSTILRQILGIREKSETKYNDLIDLMMRAKEGKENINDESDRHEFHHIYEDEEEFEITRKILNIKPSNKFITEDEMIAQGLVVFIAGYETVATTLSVCSYELALNPDVQQNLYEEVMSSLDTNGEIDYEVLTKLPFLDAVIAETLRLHSPIVKVGNIAAQDYKLGNTGIIIQKGQTVEIPIYAIHHSKQNYPNPEMFIPDRFLPENRHKIIPYTYLPFTSGPRNCIGMRFALMEVKLCLAHIIRRFQFSRCPQTDVPLILIGNLWERLLTPLPDLEIKWQRKYGKIYGKTLSRSKQHPIVGKMLSELQGDDWKRVRSITTPVFTSGKMRRMYPMVRQSVEGFINAVNEYAKDKQEVNVKEMYGCLAMDVIANCAFATKINAFKDPNNPFVTNAKDGKDNSNDESNRHESHHINEDEEELEINKKILNIKKTNKFITEDEMIAQGFVVFAAGYESTAT
ncbi:unnamed protein product, partial [Medioppia subpectinata]